MAEKHFHVQRHGKGGKETWLCYTVRSLVGVTMISNLLSIELILRFVPAGEYISGVHPEPASGLEISPPAWISQLELNETR